MRGLVLVLAAASVAVLAYALYPRSTCERTLAYSVGEVDARFGVSADQVREAARQASELCDAAGERVYRYDPEAPFKIYLHYDERQPRALAAQREKDRSRPRTRRSRRSAAAMRRCTPPWRARAEPMTGTSPRGRPPGGRFPGRFGSRAAGRL